LGYSGILGKFSSVVPPQQSEAVLWSHSRNVPIRFVALSSQPTPMAYVEKLVKSMVLLLATALSLRICSLMYVYFGAMLS